MIEGARRRATYQDIRDAPADVIAEIVDGELHLQPRPASPHAIASTNLGEELGPPFKRGRGGPGGWVILDEPELHLGPDVLVPDHAGWRRERMPEIPEVPHFDLAPDWICEILSPRTVAHDRVRKMRIFARERIPFVWLIDPIERTLEVFQLDRATYVLAASHEGQEKVHARPFDAIELDLAILWER
ncbi:MAG: Uma2 family endonuclease [Deltaproteobacteria bacterium]|nr:Uma2 family endonuclease [Deltaproteobacteria bacterium]